MNRPQVVYFPTGLLVYFPGGVRKGAHCSESLAQNHVIDIRAPPPRLQRIESAPSDATEATLVEDALEGISTNARPDWTVGSPLLIKFSRRTTR